MKTTDSLYEYNSPAKAKWRRYIHEYLLKYSLNISEDGMLVGDWLEPVGKSAIAFSQHISEKVIKESQLIGLDKNPKSISSSKMNIDNCKKLFPDAQFYCESWIDYCNDIDEKSNIKYIIYDLFTSCFGTEFRRNISATIRAIKRLLKNGNEIFLVVNADMDVAHRRDKSNIDFVENLTNLIGNSPIKYTVLNPESIYTYKNGENSDEMGTLIICFFN